MSTLFQGGRLRRGRLESTLSTSTREKTTLETRSLYETTKRERRMGEIDRCHKEGWKTLLFFLLFPPYRILERILVGSTKDIPLLNRRLYAIESLRLRSTGNLKMLLSKLDPLP